MFSDSNFYFLGESPLAVAYRNEMKSVVECLRAFTSPIVHHSALTFLAEAASRGLPVKWFGAVRQIGFTSAPRHWSYARSDDALARTHDVLATLCDIRTPVTLSDSECDLIAQIVREALETVADARPGGGGPTERPQAVTSARHQTSQGR